MANTVKTWNIASTVEGWSIQGLNKALGQLVTTNGNGGSSDAWLEMYIPTNERNSSDDGHWQWTGTFEDLGVPSGATVNGYSAASFYGRCSRYTGTIDDCRFADLAGAGAFEINDGTSRTLIANQSSFSSTTSWTQYSNNPNITGLSLASTTSVTLLLHGVLDHGNDIGATSGVGWDDISLTIEYTTGAQQASMALDQSISLIKDNSINSTQLITLNNSLTQILSGYLTTQDSLDLNTTITLDEDVSQAFSVLLNLDKNITENIARTITVSELLTLNNLITEALAAESTQPGNTYNAALVMNYIARIYK